MRCKRRFCKLRIILVITIIVVLLSAVAYIKHLRRRFAGVDPVPGWENASRNIPDYVNEKLLPHILPKMFCEKTIEPKTLLIVMISSRPESFELRQAIRETWGRKQEDATFYFMIGETGNDFILQHHLEIESRTYDDIIQERFLDTYNNLTLKSVNTLKLFSNLCTGNYKFFMKTNDDIYINVPRLIKTLLPLSNENDVLLGRVLHNVRPYRDYNSKWYIPYYWYPSNTYPDFLCGIGYVMSVDVVKKLYLCALRTPLIHCEDVFLTGICAEIMNIAPINNYHFTCTREFRFFNMCNYYENLITLHPCAADELREIGSDGMCDTTKEFRIVMQWIFFFNIQ